MVVRIMMVFQDKACVHSLCDCNLVKNTFQITISQSLKCCLNIKSDLSEIARKK